jgi:hypothetical protein
MEISMPPVIIAPEMTLGISPGVSSCTDPVAAAICWPRTLSSLRKATAECICHLLIIAPWPQPWQYKRFLRVLT